MDEEAVRSNGANPRALETKGALRRGQSSDLHLLGLPLATEWVSWSGCDVIPVGALEEVISFEWLGQ